MSPLWYLQCITLNIKSYLDTDGCLYKSDEVMKNDEKHITILRQVNFKIKIKGNELRHYVRLEILLENESKFARIGVRMREI